MLCGSQVDIPAAAVCVREAFRIEDFRSAIVVSVETVGVRRKRYFDDPVRQIEAKSLDVHRYVMDVLARVEINN